MRVLFTSVPGIGHFFPLVQLAWAMRSAGHEVLVALAEHTGRAVSAGLDVVDVAPGYSSVAVFEKTARENPDFAATVGSRPAFDLVPWAVAFANVTRPLIDGTIAVADEWRPDLVVYDQGSTAGLLAAARRGVPAVQRNLGGFRTNGLHEATGEHLTDVCEKYGISVPKPTITVEFFPPSLLVDEPEGWFMRWVPYNGGGVLGSKLERPPADRPRVAITMGTIELQTFGVGAMERMIEQAATVDAEFVLALGDIDVAPLGTLPANIRSVGWFPLGALLRTCSAVIHHGGGGSALTAVDAGLPQLIAPDPRDQFQHVTAQAVARRGIGLLTTAADVTAAMINDVLTDEKLRAATAELKDEMTALPTPADIAARIAEYLS